MCKTVEDYAKDYGQQCRIEERRNLIIHMLSSGMKPEQIAAYTGIEPEEVAAVEESMYARA